MCEIQKKIELLQKIAHRFNEANIEWALGASMLLYFKGIISEFHDIDLMVSVHDAEQVRTILSEMGELHPPASAPDPMYRTKVFMEFTIDSVDIDVMAGFSIVSEGKVYIDGSPTPLADSFIPEKMVGSYGPYTVPENCYFMLGDNRNDSKDSRSWKNKFVRLDQLVGKAVVRYYPSFKWLR